MQVFPLHHILRNQLGLLDGRLLLVKLVYIRYDVAGHCHCSHYLHGIVAFPVESFSCLLYLLFSLVGGLFRLGFQFPLLFFSIPLVVRLYFKLRCVPHLLELILLQRLLCLSLQLLFRLCPVNPVNFHLLLRVVRLLADLRPKK